MRLNASALGKSGRHRAGQLLTAAEGDLRESATEIYRRVPRGKGGKARQELTGMRETALPCKPCPTQRLFGTARYCLLGRRAATTARAFRRRFAKIDFRTRQNPAYRLGRSKKQEARKVTCSVQ